MSDGSGEPRSLRGQVKDVVGDCNDPPEWDGADVDAVIEAVADGSEYTEADAEDALEMLLKEGEVYPPTEGRVRVTP